MENQVTLDDLRRLDPKFDFNRAYKRNYCTLLMLAIRPARPMLSYTLNGVKKELTDMEARFTITERTFGTKKEFHADGYEFHFWKSQSEATVALEKIIRSHGLEKLDEAGILATYQLLEKTHMETRASIDKALEKT